MAEVRSIEDDEGLMRRKVSMMAAAGGEGTADMVFLRMLD